MAVKKKVKISNVKRTHHLKNKKNYSKTLKKKDQPVSTSKNKTASKDKFNKNNSINGSVYPNKQKVFGKVAANQQTAKKKEKQKYGPPVPKPLERTEEEEDELVNDMLEMINGDEDDDDDELSFDEAQEEEDNHLNNVQEKRKRKKASAAANEDEEDYSAAHFEQEYAVRTQAEDSIKKRKVNLLPIKHKDGEVVTRSIEVDYNSEDDVEPEDDLEPEAIQEEEEEEDSDDDIVKGIDEFSTNLAEASQKAVSTADLLMLREQEIGKQKYRIGIICSGILEKPEDKLKNFTALFDLMDDRNGELTNLVTVRKIATISLMEVFKDILPEYRIGQVNLKMQTVRKNTMERVTFENNLLQLYKKFLQKLEKQSSILTKPRAARKEYMKLGEVAVTCMCDLLLAHPYFNFAQNICQLLVYLLNCNVPTTRATILKCFQEIFKTDKKFDLTLFIVRRINHLIKSKSNCVHVEVLSCLLSLQIKNINLDAEKEHELKQKKLEAHKARLMNMSKKEKKRQKRLSQLDKQLQETKAEENKQTKHYKLTEITKMLFTVYFRILKNDPNSQLLSATLEGLAEFAHVINLDFFSDLVEVLNNIMETEDLGYREELHCIHTIFTILSGQGEVLNIDPLRFYGHLYRNLLVVNAGKNHNDLNVILRTLHEVLIKRRKNITHHRLLAFVKRLTTLCMQLLQNGTLACLGIIKTVMQFTSSLDIILDTDTSIGSGRFNPELNDPEFCNANCTSLYELTRLKHHYHPIVRKMAGHITAGVPATGDGSLNPEIGKLSAHELYKQYDSSEMAFNPPIPPPKPIDFKDFKGRHIYINDATENTCKKALKRPICSSSVNNLELDFCSAYRMGCIAARRQQQQQQQKSNQR